MSVRVLLRSDVDGLGRTGDIVDVADGYARNYLVPRGLAVKASAKITAQAEAMRKNRAQQFAADKADAEAQAAQLVTLQLSVSAKASDEGRLFGSVGAAEVAAAIQAANGMSIPAQQINGDTVKDLGEHGFVAVLHPEVQVPLTVEVTAE